MAEVDTGRDLADRVAAVVVNKDAGEALHVCVASLRRAGIDTIIVVDNASTDGSLERLAHTDRRVTIVPTGRNLGYGRAVNVGAKRTSSECILVCNPDLVVDEATPRVLLSELDAHGDVAIAAPVLKSPDGALYPSARSFPSPVVAAGHALIGLFYPNNRWSRRYRLEEPRLDQQPDWVSGACMLVRAIAFQSVGGFDERYFMYVEDLDLCWRLGQAGWRVALVPGAQVVHLHGVSASHRPYRMLVAHHVSTWRFARRALSGSSRALLPLVGLGLFARLIVALLRERARLSRGDLPHNAVTGL